MRFRVWDNKEQAIYYPYPTPKGERWGDQFAIDLSCEKYYLIEEDETKYLTVEQCWNYKLMMSTELYDLNNREIFEDDIIQFKGKDGLYIVCFGQCFAYQNDEDNYIGFFLRKVNEDPNIHYTLFPKEKNLIDCYVVGNIYQNKELLKGEQNDK